MQIHVTIGLHHKECKNSRASILADELKMSRARMVEELTFHVTHILFRAQLEHAKQSSWFTRQEKITRTAQLGASSACRAVAWGGRYVTGRSSMSSFMQEQYPGYLPAQNPFEQPCHLAYAPKHPVPQFIVPAKFFLHTQFAATIHRSGLC